MKTLTSGEYWAAYWALGRPVRNAAPHEIQQLLAGLQAAPADRGLRGVLADAMDEAGRGHEAGALRSDDPVQVWRTYGPEPELRLRRIRRGMQWEAATPERVIDILADHVRSGQRLHLSYGDPQTGRDELSEYDAHGTIGRSTGHTPIPLLIATTRSTGGGHIMDDHIVRIRTMPLGRHILYQHPAYHHGKIELVPNPLPSHPEYTHGISVDGQNQANFRTERGARQYIRKMGLTLG